MLRAHSEYARDWCQKRVTGHAATEEIVTNVAFAEGNRLRGVDARTSVK